MRLYPDDLVAVSDSQSRQTLMRPKRRRPRIRFVKGVWKMSTISLEHCAVVQDRP